MTIAYTIGAKLYLNITNKCHCRCVFCLRSFGDGVNPGESLWLEHEPEIHEIKTALKDRILNEYDEIVFCGYGEPTERLETLLEIAAYIKGKTTTPIRLNTNGLCDLINGKPVAPLLAGFIDIVSISLNAPAKERYVQLCRPAFGEESFDALLSFAAACKKQRITVGFSIVDVIQDDEIDRCRELAAGMGIPLRVRHTGRSTG